jgi:hypothetical protein
MNRKVDEKRLIKKIIGSLPKGTEFDVPSLLKLILVEHLHGNMLGKKRIDALKAKIYHSIKYLLLMDELEIVGKYEGYTTYRKTVSDDEKRMQRELEKFKRKTAKELKALIGRIEALEI